jgi:hypothetical protein
MPKGRFSASELALWRDQYDFKICALKMKHLLIRAWRQKIEAWLQENEKEEKQNEELKRRSRRVQSNRRSLEADSGKYRSLCVKISSCNVTSVHSTGSYTCGCVYVAHACF